MCGCAKHHDETAVCTCICPEHANYDAAYALAMRRYDELTTLAVKLDAAEAQVEDLQRQLAEAVGQAEAAKQATREIMTERNTWARQLADMRDERETAREETEKAREMLSIASNNRDNLHLAVERLAEAYAESTVYYGRTITNDIRRTIERWSET